MCDESIYARPDVYMAGRILRKYSLCNMQILVEIMSRRSSTLSFTV